jgi:phosphoglycolate phosphatase
MTRRAVLLDLDGTLVDTAPDLVAVINTMLAQHDRPPLPYALARNEVSNGALGLIRIGFPTQTSAAELERLRLKFLDIYLKAVCINSRLFNGLDDLLHKLEDIGCPWGIVTNKPHAMTEPLLAQLNLTQRTSCVISGDRLKERKPHPAPLQLAAAELGLEPDQCIYVGDAPRDIDAGRAAGMATIAAAYGYIRQTDDPYSWGADLVIHHPSKLLDACDRLEPTARSARRA